MELPGNVVRRLPDINFAPGRQVVAVRLAELEVERVHQMQQRERRRELIGFEPNSPVLLSARNGLANNNGGNGAIERNPALGNPTTNSNYSMDNNRNHNLRNENLSQIDDEDRDSVLDSKEEHKSEGTFYSDPSSIPSEHSLGMDYNECLKRYCLKIVTITWNRDSHGLFDFETRQLAREHF